MPEHRPEIFAASGELRLRIANEILSANQRRSHQEKVPELMAVADLTYGAAVCFFGALVIAKGQGASITGNARKVIQTGRSYITPDSRRRVNSAVLRLHNFEQHPTMSETALGTALRETRNLIREIQNILDR